MEVPEGGDNRVGEFFAGQIAKRGRGRRTGERWGNSWGGARREASGCARSRRSTWSPTSGQASEKRRRLDELTNAVWPGDRLVVSELSRLGRSLAKLHSMDRP